MKKIITIGSATQDIFIVYEDAETLHLLSKQGKKSFLLLEQGIKIDVNQLHYATGGGATNTAVGFKRLGLDVSTYFKIGTDKAGQFIQEQLTQEDINISTISCADTTNTAISFIIPTPNKDYTALVYRGLNTTIKETDLPAPLLSKSNLVYITSLSGQSAQLLPIISKIAKDTRVTVAINPGIKQITHNSEFLYNSLKYVDILILNKIESQKLMLELLKKNHASVHSSEISANMASEKTPALLKFFMTHNTISITLLDYFKILLELGPKIIVVTNGSEGVYVATEQACYFHPSMPTNVVSTVGAGDAFGSCFVGCLELGYSIEQAILYGVINSSSVLTHFGAKTGLLTLEELQQKATKLVSNQLQIFHHK